MIKFSTLWNNFPEKNLMKQKCRNKQETSNNAFDNYCSILMSECLIKSGIRLNHIKATRCWSHAGNKHILRAEDLAKGLKSNLSEGISYPIRVKPDSFQKALKDKTGIIFFKDYWVRGNETFLRRSGDHIDLWNKNKMTSSSMFVRGILEILGRVSDLNKSKEIWFWEVE